MNVVERLRLHVEASAKRDEFARKAIALLADGKDKAGIAAAEKAEFWALKAKALEP